MEISIKKSEKSYGKDFCPYLLDLLWNNLGNTFLKEPFGLLELEGTLKMV